MKEFWNWKSRKIRDQAGEEVSERVLFLNGTIAEESWFDDDVTPELFREELNAGQGNITVWINSPGGEGAAMSQTIKIDQLADTVMKGMEEYARLAADDLKKDVRKAGDTVKKQIESAAPKKTGKYSKSWAVKKTRETSDSIQVVVHSRRYQLTHLLEFGHAKRGGGRTRAFPHIAPAEQAGIEQLTRDIERDLQKGG